MAYLFINTNTTTALASHAGVRLDKIVVENAGTAWRVQVFDSATGSGQLVADLNPPIVGANYDFGDDADTSNGFTVVTSGTTPGVVTITYN